MSFGGLWCRVTASSAPGIRSGTTRPIGFAVPPDREEPGRLAAAVLEDLARVQASGWPARGEVLRPEGRVELAERSLPPGEDVVAIDGLFDADRGGRDGGA